MPIAVTTPAARRAGEVAADDGADRQRHEEPDEHQRRHQLGAGVDGRAANIGMSISAAISAAPTKKLTSIEPQAGVRRTAPRGTSGRGGAGQVEDEGDRWRAAAPTRYQEPLVGEDLDPGSAVANARITPASARARRSAPRCRPRGRGPTRGGRRAAAVA